MEFDLIRLAFVYLHLLACCIALGTILLSDIEQGWMLWRSGKPDLMQQGHLERLHTTITLSLAVLWATGIAILLYDSYSAGWHQFANPKLQAKIGLVTLLTINGQVLNKLIFPILKRDGHLIHMRPSHALFAIFCGSVSAVTWLYAALLGVGRFLSWKYTLFELLWMWPIAVILSTGFMTVLVLLKRKQLRDSTRVSQPPRIGTDPK